MTMPKDFYTEMGGYKNLHLNDDEEDDIMHTKAELKAILTYPDITGRSFEELKGSIQESSFGYHASGRPVSMRDLALQYHVSLRTVAYALNPGIRRSVEESDRVYATQRGEVKRQ